MSMRFPSADDESLNQNSSLRHEVSFYWDTSLDSFQLLSVYLSKFGKFLSVYCRLHKWSVKDLESGVSDQRFTFGILFLIYLLFLVYYWYMHQLEQTVYDARWLSIKTFVTFRAKSDLNLQALDLFWKYEVDT